ncbi:sorting nexin lst-4-like isoform X1 [Tigriopus californicus]|uniref:sorting nexin lst-4-like isoform X1 n=1 Tax=Tigriopus californicus TaxID=6832 RepID=UPI0027D9DAF0|nr:sorting nexin lst-4-like isoform X1 [Tigriopus californicus]
MSMVLYDHPPDAAGSALQVQVLYDFEAQPDTGELSIVCGEVLTVIRTDVGEGWWEGMNPSGDTGLFPEAYVREITDDPDDGGPPSMAPPPLPPDYSSPGSDNHTQMGWQAPAASHAAPASTANNDDWGNGAWGVSAQPTPDAGADPWSQPAAPPATAPVAPTQPYQNNQAYDDDWDSDFDEPSASHNNNQMPPPNTTPGGGMLGVPKNAPQTGSMGDVSSIGRSDSKKAGTGAATTRTSFNRFSTFVKSGGENFVLGKINVNVQENDIIQVVDSGDGRYSWLNAQPPFSCSIASPKKESKLKGLKSFIAYQLTPSFNNIQVSRRYKHFDWLHERLSEKFSFIPIPPLPDKQIQGRYEDEFIEHRRKQLQSFVDRVCRHPILSQSEVWQHFLTCTDDKKWKAGKRKAEKDSLVGGALYLAVRGPNKPIDPAHLEREISVFTTFSANMDASVKNMVKVCSDQTQKYQTHLKREYSTIGKSFTQLGESMQLSGDNNANINLTNAITMTGEAYEEISELFEEQPKNDWERFGDVMHDYRGLLAGWPNVLQIHQGAVGKKKEFERLALDGKFGQAELIEMGNRTDTMSYGVLAEVNTFHGQRTTDMKLAHQQFLQEQITFYQKVTEKLQDALRNFDNC